MSLASPWVSVLGGLAERSAPVGYGVAALFGLRQLLNMVMTWQRHRLEISEREQAMELYRAAEREIAPMVTDEQRRVSVANEIAGAGSALGDIREADLIDPDDPRATGEQTTTHDL
ncbi:hypothetical protein ED92_10885 [Amycolatopsis sp. MJM2582]|uniref:hypothetical protein n=1 Tax=Amycolatopsis sp. MJM2582 TaxID=1427749 RepID=UPI000504A300|nr:hypothetical protein [Amycolatopsis sp. MJM2582]KFZ80826.1 hypothetical protein ED92_10885 [Amycolatopsis sp. MJM2582]